MLIAVQRRWSREYASLPKDLQLRSIRVKLYPVGTDANTIGRANSQRSDGFGANARFFIAAGWFQATVGDGRVESCPPDPRRMNSTPVRGAFGFNSRRCARRSTMFLLSIPISSCTDSVSPGRTNFEWSLGWEGDCFSSDSTLAVERRPPHRRLRICRPVPDPGKTWRPKIAPRPVTKTPSSRLRGTFIF